MKWRHRAWRGCAGLLLGGTFSAAALADADVGGGLGLASAQTQRGLSTSSGHAAVFADGWWRFAPAWQASLGLARWPAQPGRASGDYTLALSRSWQQGEDWTLALGASHYGPLGGEPRRRVDYDEASFTVGWRGRGQLLLALSPNSTNTTAEGALKTARTTTVELNWHQPLPALGPRVALDAGLGHYSLRAFGRPGYRYASLGLSVGVGAWQWSLARVANEGVSPNVPPELRRGRWLLSLWWSV